MRTGDTGREHAVSTRLEPRAEVDAPFSAFHDQTTRALRLDRRRVELGTFCPAAELATLDIIRPAETTATLAVRAGHHAAPDRFGLHSIEGAG